MESSSPFAFFRNLIPLKSGLKKEPPGISPVSSHYSVALSIIGMGPFSGQSVDYEYY